ncbi:hypothetical protein ES703_59271 [subsurface metagenome]
MAHCLRAEVPEVNKLSVAHVVFGRLKFCGPRITLANKRLGCYLGILDQKIEAGCNGGLAAAAVSGI